MNYSEGKIYKLYIRGLEEICYIGSTTTSLSERLCMHRHQYQNPNQKKCVSHQLFEEGNEVEIQLLEDYPCESKKELEERERYWIEKYPDCINKNIPTRGWKERWILNRDHNLAKHKEWIEKNKQQQKEYRKQHHAKKVSCSLCHIVITLGAWSNHKKNKHQDQEASYTQI